MIHYLLSVTLCWFIFYSIYYIFFERETFFKSNRFYLMASLISGLLFPLVQYLPSFTVADPLVIVQSAQLIADTSSSITYYIQPAESSSFSWGTVLMVFYFAGFLLALAKMMHGLYRIYQLYKKGTKQSLEMGITLVLSDEVSLPFSFFSCVFAAPSFLKHPSYAQIMHHESIHVKGRHTLDILFLEFLAVLFWWNPMIVFYRRALKQTHEYLADFHATQRSDKTKYGHILIGQGRAGMELALTHQFYNSHLKKRIDMIYKEKSVASRRSRYLLVVPLIAFLALVFSCSSELGFEGKAPSELVEIMDELTMEENMKNSEFWKHPNFAATYDLSVPNPVAHVNNLKIDKDKGVLHNYCALIRDHHFAKYKNYIEKRYIHAAELFGKDLSFHSEKEGIHSIESYPIGEHPMEQEIDRILDQELTDQVFKNSFGTEKPAMERMKSMMEGKDLLGIYSELANNTRYAGHKDYIEEKIVAAAADHGRSIQFTPNGEGKYCMRSEPSSGEGILSTIDELTSYGNLKDEEKVLYVLNGRSVNRSHLETHTSEEGYSLRIYTEKDISDAFLNLHDIDRLNDIVVRIETEPINDSQNLSIIGQVDKTLSDSGYSESQKILYMYNDQMISKEEIASIGVPTNYSLKVCFASVQELIDEHPEYEGVYDGVLSITLD